MRSKTIVLLESNEALLRELKSTFEKEEEVEVVYAGDDGEVGIQELRRLKPQLVFVGRILHLFLLSFIIRSVFCRRMEVYHISHLLRNPCC